MLSGIWNEQFLTPLYHNISKTVFLFSCQNKSVIIKIFWHYFSKFPYLLFFICKETSNVLFQLGSRLKQHLQHHFSFSLRKLQARLETRRGHKKAFLNPLRSSSPLQSRRNTVHPSQREQSMCRCWVPGRWLVQECLLILPFARQ